MAEILIMIGDIPGEGRPKDGDVRNAYNDECIQYKHADTICGVKVAGFNRDGLRAKDSLPDMFQSKTYQYKFERISHTEIRRIRLFDGHEDIIGPTPNAEGEYMDVPLYLNRRTRHPQHRIFGTLGKEYWYGGRERPDKLSEIWTEIEDRTTKRKRDHTRYPLTPPELAKNLAVTTDDFDQRKIWQLMEVEWDKDPELENAV